MSDNAFVTAAKAAIDANPIWATVSAQVADPNVPFADSATVIAYWDGHYRDRPTQLGAPMPAGQP